MADFRRVISLVFSTFVNITSFIVPFLKIIAIFALFYAVGIRLSDVYLASIFGMVSSSGFHVSVIIMVVVFCCSILYIS